PLDGPFFEETLYVTPSRLPAPQQAAIRECAARAAEALGLREGPVHAELRVNDRDLTPRPPLLGREGEPSCPDPPSPRRRGGRGVRLRPWLLEVNPRSIGGRCSRVLRFGAGMSLEEIILRQALRLEIPSLEREQRPAGVMMLPIPGPGILEAVRGQEAALAVPGIEEILMTAHPGQKLVPLPEGAPYLGFMFAHAASP